MYVKLYDALPIAKPMKVLRFDHNTERALEDATVRECVAGLVAALEKSPVPFWRGKSEKQASKSILQPVLNAFIKQELVDAGWDWEYRMTGADDGAGGMRVDFCKHVGTRLIAVEVELGNGASLFRDLVKFQHLQCLGRLALAIYVDLTDETARLTDSGLTTHEMVVRRIHGDFAETAAKGIPILCLGLSHQNSVLVDFAQSRFPNPKVLQGDGAQASIAHAVGELRRGVPIELIAPPGVIRAPLRSRTSAAQAELL
jgi:hypothetical protein